MGNKRVNFLKRPVVNFSVKIVLYVVSREIQTTELSFWLGLQELDWLTTNISGERNHQKCFGTNLSVVLVNAGLSWCSTGLCWSKLV